MCELQDHAERADGWAALQVKARASQVDLQVASTNSSTAFNITLLGTSVACYEISIRKASNVRSTGVTQPQAKT